MASKYIPKIIHQSFLSDSLPLEINKNIQDMKSVNPRWEYRFYDNKEIEKYIKYNYSHEILNIYMKINPIYGAARADFFRYLLMYKEGGLWLDIKSSVRKSLDLTLKKNDYFILSQWQNKMGEKYQGWGLFPELAHIPGGEFQQWHILTAVHNPALKSVIENTIRCIKNYDVDINGVGRKGVLLTTGPIIYTLSVLPHLKNLNHRFVDIQNEFNIHYTIYKDFEYRKLYKKHYSVLEDAVIL